MTPRELIDRNVAAMRAGERETAYTFFADDIVFHIPGRSQFAGTHRSREAAVAYIESAIARSHAGEVELELVDTSRATSALPSSFASASGARQGSSR